MSSLLRAPRSAIILIGIVWAVAGFLPFYQLGSLPFQDYDEATYAEVTVESFARDDFLSLQFLGVDYFRKPPLMFWMMGASNKIAHAPKLSDRLPSAIAGFLLVGVVMLAVYAATRNGFAAAFGGALLLSMEAFLAPARQVRFDILVSFFNLCAVYAFYRALKEPVWFLGFGMFIGLAFMSKGPLILYALIPCLVLAVLSKSWEWLRDRYFWGGVAIAALIVLPWHIHQTLQFGLAFWQEYLGVQVLQRVTEVLFVVPTTNATYFTYLFGLAAPATELFCLTLIAVLFLKPFSKKEFLWYAAAVAGIATILAVCLITKTKATTYLIPIYPYIAIGAAIATCALIRRAAKPVAYTGIAVCFALACLGVWQAGTKALTLSADTHPEIKLAYEEKAIGQYLRTVKAPTFYVYNTTTLGSIMFYSGIVQPPWISDSGMPPDGNYLLYQTQEEQKLRNEYPDTQLRTVVYGSFLTLAQIGPTPQP